MPRHNLKQPTNFRISTYTMGGYLCSDVDENNKIIPLHILSRILPITTDNTSDESVAAKNSQAGCYVAISDYIDNDYTDMPRGRTAEDKRVYKLPSQVFNNQLSIRYKYWGFRCISYKVFSNGEMQFTGIMDPKWEPVHIASRLIEVIHSLQYRIYTDSDDGLAEAVKYANDNNLDYILVWNSRDKRVTYRRRNLEIYDLTGIMKSGVRETTGASTWLTHDAATKLIKTFFQPIAAEKEHLDSVMDHMRNIPEFTADIRRAIFETDEGLGRYRHVTALNNQYTRCNDIEFKRLVQNTVKKILKTFSNYEDRLCKLLKTDNNIADQVNTTYRRRIMAAYRRKTPPIVLEYPTPMTAQPYRISNVSIDLINSDFNTRYVNLLPIISALLTQYGIYNYYKPNNKYPGIITRFAYNPKYINAGDASGASNSATNGGNAKDSKPVYKPGKCYCTPRCVAGNKTSSRRNSTGQCTFITINIFRTGSIMITAARNIDQIRYVYAWINGFLQANANRVFTKLPDGRDYALENEDRNIVKKTELHYIPITQLVGVPTNN